MSFLVFFKRTFLPIKEGEYSKVFLICLLKSCISAVYAILYNIKDTIVITAEGSGAEAIAVIKGFLALPVSILFVYIYSNLSNKFKSTVVFYFILTFFCLSFFLYSFLLRPYENFLKPDHGANVLMHLVGSSNSHWVAVFRNWIHTYFYLVAELWSQACIFILFWEFVNRVCTIDEAKRSYNLFIAAGSLSYFITSTLIYNFIKLESLKFDSKIQVLMIFAIFLVVIMMIVYQFLNKNIISKHLIKTKTKLSFIQGLRYISKSKYLISITVMVIAVGLSINLVELTFKANLKLFYTTKAEMIGFISKVSGLQNLLSLFVVMLISGNALRKLSWKTNAVITPLVILITGTLFFLASKQKSSLGPLSKIIKLNPLKLVIYLGAFQVISSKIAKYCFFDLTKEIAYIPLGNEARLKGKAAIDAVGSRLGKSGSSYIHVIILWIVSTNSVLNVTVFLIPILFLIIFLWFTSINYISKKLK